MTSADPIADRRPADEPIVFTLFGATGDLAHRMVLPAYFQLFQRGLLPENWLLVGNGRGDTSHTEFREVFRKALQDSDISPSDDEWKQFSDRLRFAGGGFDSNDPGSLLDVLDEAHDSLCINRDDARYIHYLAIPPVAFEETTKGLAAHQLLDGSRVIYEKPFGTSPESFKELDELVHSVMKEDQVYRIDHFLGKEATQNLHVLRFANSMFGGIWNSDHVSQVQIDVPETLDVANRAKFYDATGAFRDMIVTHLFQVAAEVAMEPPASFGAADLQDAREAILASFRTLDPKEAVFGQYDGYRDLPDVPDDSKTDTYAAVTLWVDTDRWRGVPFYLRSGKQLAESQERVTLVLKTPEGPLTGVPADANVSVSLKGTGSMATTVVLKKPGPGLDLDEQKVELALDDAAHDGLPPYVALLHDVTIGDRSLFTSSSGLQEAWRAAAPLLDNQPDPQGYKPGSWGPEAGESLPGSAGWLTKKFS
jgi:glucose-6-phosphate 1-dehydrogenase